MEKTCAICVKTYTDHSRKPIECPRCHNFCCKKCVIRYFDSSEMLKCMFCGVESFAPEYLNQICGSFREVIGRITKKLLYDEEASLFNSTRDLVTMYKNIDSATEKELFLKSLPDMRGSGTYANIMRQCPVATCNGHFMIGDYQCGACKLIICKNCGEIEADGHVCDPTVLESITAIKQIAKNCPKCGVSIEKIDGCDQMFCTDCKTAFDWTTLKVIHTGIENPHYFEWIRSMNQEVARDTNDITCGGLTTYQEVHQANEAVLKNSGIDRKCGMYNLNASTLIAFQVYIHDIHERILSTLIRAKDNTDLRIKFMCGEINKSTFTTAIFKRHNKMLKYDKEFEIYKLIRDAGTDILQRWTREKTFFEIHKLQRAVAEVDELITCVNHGFARVSEMNSSVLKRLNKRIESIGYLSKYSTGHYRVNFTIEWLDSM